ncbi:MAG: hypothetical protein A2664_04615 [Candidatus Taylorbacteria bacterium RIFCSPHIGHO2_01_FULL_46_22b]|uniref:Isoleucine--tRNA ligase n=1 Tax=Candidatus Taylorbacteria bacterium RIFCSPHIGHO2_01_FULL_46_22b TaxID=1802301 RepID=A0A1G2M6T2_9BACT|nr:MAG: hypothetical protein A2664_04615 [Candidatus Taylorbacteria bacterium RIFCSPHIGHO2_01_FULL_46_22b]
MSEKPAKSKLSEQELSTLSFWREHQIFEKSLEKNKDSGREFIFFEGPPTANGKPGIHHLEARAFKDAIPRYKTMRGFHVRRKGGWDTHGLPVEIAVEKELGLKSKKEIEQYGLAAFNEKCKGSVWKYVHEWEDFTERMGYWVDLKNPYITYKPEYIESLWNIVKTVNDKGLLYKDYKVVPWCPRCGTGLSSHELAQGYQDVKDLSVTVKFKVVGQENTFLLAWTTTPWTLPGNVGLAIGKDIEYVVVRVKGGEEKYILATERLSILDKEYSINETYKGKDLVGLEYEPLYPFIKENISGPEKVKLTNAYKVYAADFVTTADGTGIVHTAVMYGQDDFELGTKVGLPKYHLVNEDGTFKKEAGFLAGKFVKQEETDVSIIKDLANRPSGSLLFHKEKYQHSYPHCWRCKTPLIYFARDSWYIKMSALRDSLVKENESINWEPSYIKEGRFGEWLKEVKDWAISRERYWGTPLPVWVCEQCKKQKVAGSIEDISKKPRNDFFVVRHGQSENNVENTLNSDISKQFHLTKLGKEEAQATGEKLSKEQIDVVFASPFVRTKETAEIIADAIGYPREKIIFDDRLRELGFGTYEGKTVDDYISFFSHDPRAIIFLKAPEGAENRQEAKNRVGAFLKEIDQKYEGKRILIVSHEGVIWMMESAMEGLDVGGTLVIKNRGVEFIDNAEVKRYTFKQIPRNENFELDLHRPYIDAVTFPCECGGEMRRVKEVMDVWFDSGSMPFAQDHFPFGKRELQYPADFICEAIDQTRGWFYTLHAIGALMGKGKAFKNSICLGHILDAEGKKMSKSVGNVVDPQLMMEKYGADPLRFWMYSINQPGESKNFDERTVDEVVKKVFNLASNVLSFYQLYAPASPSKLLPSDSNLSLHILDRWILARLNQLTAEVTKGLESYSLLEPARAIRDFIADLSQWYIRRSRDRFKEEGKDKASALVTTRFVLLELSKLMAPFTPFFADYLYQSAKGERESVHLEEWRNISEKRLAKSDQGILEDMSEVRKVVSLALEARAKANIKVRQPLATLRIKNNESGIQKNAELLALIQDEVNVKKILVDEKIAGDVELDVAITPELKKEGDVREIIRTIQELRKEKGLQQGEMATLLTSSEVAKTGLLQEFEMEIKKVTSLSAIMHGSSSSGDFELKN